MGARSLSIQAKDDMIGGDDQQIALELLQDLLFDAVMHVGGVVGVQLVNDDFIRKLNSQSVTINGYLLDQIPAFDAHFLIRDQVLNDHVRHVVSV